jgi:putative peptidoglycan lipid II flippase
VVNLTLNLSLHDRLGYVGLALGTSLGAVANVAVLMLAFRRVTGRGIPGGVAGQLLRVGVAAVGMTVVVVLAERGLVGLIPLHGKLLRLVEVGVGIGVGAAVYALLCRGLGVGEVDTVVAAIRRRIRR